MKHEYSLAHLTVLALPPVRMIEVAARAGYTYVGLRLTRVTRTEILYPLITNRALMNETKTVLSATGVSVWDVELARMGPDNTPESYAPLLEAAAELGARHVITQLPDPERQRAQDRFARICDLAAPLGLGIDLEFPSWTETPDLSAAAEVLYAVEKPNAGILVDLLHFDRSDSSLEELKRLPQHWFRYAHVCDAPREKPSATEGLVRTARAERLFPGDGGIDVRGILSCMPCYIPYALEIPGDTLAEEIGLEEYACRALRASRSYLDLPLETCLAGAPRPTSQARR
jgi:sugar phosphate isomerase/epimerase